jgi:hypothetical protein
MGCGQEDPGAPAAPSVVLEDAYSPTGSLIVVRDEHGQLSMAVQGRINVDEARVLKSGVSQGSLADIYLSLHPDAKSVPDHIRALSDELSVQRKAALANLTPDQLRKGAPVQVPKDRNAFLNSTCTTPPPNFTGWTPRYCDYHEGWNTICTFGTIGTNDKSFAWNESPYWGSHTLLGMSWVQRVPPWTFYWAQWGGVYDGRWSCLALDNGQGGNIGITWHDYFTDVALNPVNE